MAANKKPIEKFIDALEELANACAKLPFSDVLSVGKILNYPPEVIVEVMQKPATWVGMLKSPMPNSPLITGFDWREVDACLSRGEKLQAIKAFRVARDCGLKEAKEAVDERYLFIHA